MLVAGIKVSPFGRENADMKTYSSNPASLSPANLLEQNQHCTGFSTFSTRVDLSPQVRPPYTYPYQLKKTPKSSVGTFFFLFSSTEATSSAVSFSSRFRFPLSRIERISLLVSIFVGEMDVCVVQYIPMIEYAGWESR